MGYSKGVIFIENQMISISDLRKVGGIGNKTIERIKERLEQNELDKQYVSKYDEGLHLDANEIHLGDCLELMNGIPDKSIDMILVDPPYGTTQCKWDEIIDFDKLWKQYERVIKDSGAILIFGNEPFSTKLRNSNSKLHRYDIVWKKSRKTGFLNVSHRPLKCHEDILVFYKNIPTYKHTELTRLNKPVNSYRRGGKSGDILGKTKTMQGRKQEYTNYNSDIVEFENEHNVGDHTHPTQKPVALLEYLIKTYTNERDLILDNCIGSGSTVVAAIKTGRNYIGIELDEKYYNIANNRINDFKNGLFTCLQNE